MIRLKGIAPQSVINSFISSPHNATCCINEMAYEQRDYGGGRGDGGFESGGPQGGFGRGRGKRKFFNYTSNSSVPAFQDKRQLRGGNVILIQKVGPLL